MYPGLGFIPPPGMPRTMGVVPVVLTGAVSVISAVSKLFGGVVYMLAERKAFADGLASQAAAGDRLALLRLKCLGGLAMPEDAASYKAAGLGDCGLGWPTSNGNPRAYAAALYQGLTGRESPGPGPGMLPLGTGPSGMPPIATGRTFPPLAFGTPAGGFAGMSLLALGGVVVAGYLLLKRRGRRGR